MMSVLLKTLLRRQQRLPESAPGNGGLSTVDFRLTSNLNYTCEHHLRRLQKLLELRYQQHYLIDEDRALRAMIHFASGLQEPDIQRELLLFYLNCHPRVRAFLRSGEMLEASHYLRQGDGTDDLS